MSSNKPLNLDETIDWLKRLRRSQEGSTLTNIVDIRILDGLKLTIDSPLNNSVRHVNIVTIPDELSN